MTDIVKRLRSMADKKNLYSVGQLWNACDEAADEIERLREGITSEQTSHDTTMRGREKLEARVAELEAQRPDIAAPVDEREAFEAWASGRGFDLSENWAVDGNNFESADTRLAYEIWQAARAPLGAVPEYNGWYCAQCERGVDPSEVTYNEAHTECGRIITNDRPSALTATGGRDELLGALSDAAQSLETISRQAGRDEFMVGMDDVRAYANSRARVAREALAAAKPAQEGE